jgi:hypothetical protein
MPTRRKTLLQAISCCSLVGAALAFFSPATLAVPVAYKVTFDTSNTALSGVGSFVYNDATDKMTSFVWDFGSGLTGGFTDFFLGEVSGGVSFGKFIFGILSGATPNAIGGNSAADVTGPFPNISYFICGGVNSDLCGFNPVSAVQSSATYQFIGSSQDGLIRDRGIVTIAPTSSAVPEPGTLLLFGIAVAGLRLSRQRRVARPA